MSLKSKNEQGLWGLSAFLLVSLVIVGPVVFLWDDFASGVAGVAVAVVGGFTLVVELSVTGPESRIVAAGVGILLAAVPLLYHAVILGAS